MADNIEQLIEAVQEQGIGTNNVLQQSVDFQDLQLEALFEIKDVLVETQLSFMEYFASEQGRFDQQQLDLRDKELSEIERNRELKDSLTRDDVSPISDKQDASGGASGGAFAGGLVGGGVAGAAGALAKRFLPFAAVLGAGGAGLKFLENLQETGSAMEATGETVGDVYDFAFLPVLNSGLELMAEELGYNNEQLIESQIALAGFRENLELAAEDLFRDVKRFFGEETAGEAAAESDQRVAGLRSDLQEVQTEIREAGLDASPGGEIETGLARREEIAVRLQEIAESPRAQTALGQTALASEERELRREQGRLTQRLAPVLEEQRIQGEIKQEQEKGRLAQSGFEAGDLETPAQKEFAGLSSQDKKQYFMDNVSPDLKQASERGAIDINDFMAMSNLMNPISFASGGAIGIPLSGIDIDKLKTLSADQLEAILLNDDVLKKSTLQVGALDTRDRMVIEHMYRETTTANASTPAGFAARSFAQPSSQISPTAANIASNPNMIQAGSGMAPVPTARNYDTSLNGLLNAPIGRASQEVDDNRNTGPIIINAPTQGGDSVHTTVNNSQNTIVGGGASARSNQPSYLRSQDRQQGSN